jgi:hypothetical protein
MSSKSTSAQKGGFGLDGLCKASYFHQRARKWMKIARRGTRHSHFYRCAKGGKLVDKRELRDVIFHETDQKRNPRILRIRGEPIQTRRRDE